MSVRNFLTSKTFFIQLAIALLIIVVVVFAMLQWLNFSTNHGQEIPVPDLRKMTVEKAGEVLEEIDLDYIVLDTVEFRADYPALTIVQQDPLPNVTVKEGRKVYIKVNAKGYSTVVLPNLIQKTYRAAIPQLKAVGLEEGKKTYKPYLAKDVVLEVWQGGKKLKAGDKIMKASKVDFVLGDGTTGFDESELEPDGGEVREDIDMNGEETTTPTNE